MTKSVPGRHRKAGTRNRWTRAALVAAAFPLAGVPALGAAPTVAGAAELLGDDAATVLHHGPTPWDMTNNLSGEPCEEPRVCREVYYQWILPLGTVEIGVDSNVETLDYAIKNITADGAGDKKIVYAFSGGARVASVWLDEHADDVDAPDAEDLTFVLIGNGGRKYGGINGWWYGDALLTPTDTQYSVIDVAREYDPIADFPDNPFNLLALANALAAFYYVHLDYSDVDLDDDANYVWTEGNTTYVFVPTDDLPLLQGLRDLGLDWLADEWEEPLREIIDEAYDRDYLEDVEPQGEQSPVEESADLVEISSLSAVQDSTSEEATSDDVAGRDSSVEAESEAAAAGGNSLDVLGDIDSSGTTAGDGPQLTPADVEDPDADVDSAGEDEADHTDLDSAAESIDDAGAESADDANDDDSTVNSADQSTDSTSTDDS